MTKHIIKTDQSNGNFRISVPKKFVYQLGWKDERYMIIESNEVDEVVLRRLINGEDIKR